MYAMSGASLAHVFIVANLIIELGRQLSGTPCAAVSNDLRLYVKDRAMFTYPDVIVLCPASENFFDAEQDTLLDAVVIVEVLSPSTRNYDRGEKFLYYRSLPSFTDYLLIAQDSIRAEHHHRQPDNSWLMREYTSGDDVLLFPSIGCQLKLGSLYERVRFQQ